MRKLTLIAVLFCAGKLAVAQGSVLNDPISATMFSSEKYSGISGSPFLSDKWSKGYVTVQAGIYKNLELKYDAYENTLYFNRDDQPYQFQERVLGFTLTPNPRDSFTFIHYRNGLSGAGIRPNQFVQVIAEGKLSIYRSDIKLVTEVNQINQGIIKTFNTSVRYVSVKDGAAQVVKLNKQELLDLMQDKKSEVEKYADENKLIFKKEFDVRVIVNYYNKL